MSKENEIAYIDNLSKIHNVSHTEVEEYHLQKPFSDARCGYYLMDVGQIMMMLPPAPARILDLGVGSGWTSAMLARNGYSVLGLDIAPDMIAIAQRHTAPHLNLHFEVHDYESSIDFGLFDAAVIYDALHHAIDEASVIKNVFCCLKQNGIFITMEPGVGHSTSPDSLEAMKKFGTTEKDMEYSRQAKLMREAGFGSICQYLRLNQLSLEDVATESGNIKQREHFDAISYATVNGLTSLVVAVKDANVREDLVRSQSQLQQTQAELVRSQSQLQEARAKITAMETSKFWKLRIQWFKLKRLIRLNTQDE